MTPANGLSTRSYSRVASRTTRPSAQPRIQLRNRPAVGREPGLSPLVRP
jgi:hypothetical protein